MRILLDECVPAALAKLLPEHQCSTVQKQGWGGVKNGELLRRAESAFDIFITADKSLRYQQNLAGRRIAIVQISALRLREVGPISVALQRTLKIIKAGDFHVVDIKSSKGR